jgi:hypothetical protein
MLNVLVVAKDDCIRTSLAGVLKSLGFSVFTSHGSPPPDALVAWEPDPNEVRELRTTHVDAAIVVCTSEHRRAWDGATAVVPMPFNASRVARELARAVRRQRVAA